MPKFKSGSQPPALTVVAVAGVLSARASEPVTIFESAMQAPFFWSDYPAGYSVFPLSYDIFTGDCPVSVRFKGRNVAEHINAAVEEVTHAGYACHKHKAAGCKRPAWLYVGLPKAVG